MMALFAQPYQDKLECHTHPNTQRIHPKENTMSKIRAWAAHGPGQPLVPYEYEAGTLGPEEVEIVVESCGLCHSDLSMRNNDWGMSTYPFIPGHEVVGRVVALGEQTKGLTIGQRVGLGWTAQSCLHCHECLSGNHHLCSQAVPTIVGHYGGFAERVRARWAWAMPLPDELDASAAGPLSGRGI